MNVEFCKDNPGRLKKMRYFSISGGGGGGFSLNAPMNKLK